MIFPPQHIALATDVVRGAQQKKLRLATAESCTGGLICGCITEIPGTSEIFDQGFITYSYEAKTARLGVPADTLTQRGAVSAEVALGMARGALAASTADIVISATGIAGPGGGTADKPVGLVWLAIATRGGTAFADKNLFKGDRAEVRLQTVERALLLLKKEIDNYKGENA